MVNEAAHRRERASLGEETEPQRRKRVAKDRIFRSELANRLRATNTDTNHGAESYREVISDTDRQTANFNTVCVNDVHKDEL